MKTKKLFFALSLILSVGLLTQCEKGGKHVIVDLGDDDSDKPVWAGGNTDANDKNNKPGDGETGRPGDYGDLLVILRDADGVPDMVQTTADLDVWVVQPSFIGVDGYPEPLELDAEGELVDPTLATGVEFGRLNIVRSPVSVLDQAFDEAMKVLTAPDAEITLDFCGRLTSTYFDGSEMIVKTIDSPRENMAIYKHIMNNMFTSDLAFLGDYGLDPLLVAASCFAAGSDKTGTVDIDEVVYINGFMDCIGLNPILNEHEYDFNHDNKWYFNFGDCYGDGNYSCQYNREDVYSGRYIQFKVLNNIFYPDDEEGNPTGPIYSIFEVMLGDVDGIDIGVAWWGAGDDNETHVKGFAWAIDDAVQVLDFVHGDSNISFLSGYTGPSVPVP